MKLQDAVRLAKHASKHANIDNAKRFTQHVVPEVMRPARVVWNQAIGAVFLVFAVSGATLFYRSLQTKSTVGQVISIIFTIVMMSFGISSFLKARRIAARVNR